MTVFQVHEGERKNPHYTIVDGIKMTENKRLLEEVIDQLEDGGAFQPGRTCGMPDVERQRVFFFLLLYLFLAAIFLLFSLLLLMMMMMNDDDDPISTLLFLPLFVSDRMRDGSRWPV